MSSDKYPIIIDKQRLMVKSSLNCEQKSWVHLTQEGLLTPAHTQIPPQATEIRYNGSREAKEEE